MIRLNTKNLCLLAVLVLFTHTILLGQISQWTQIGQKDGGDITSLDYFQFAGNSVYCTSGSILYKSNGFGEGWQSVDIPSGLGNSINVVQSIDTNFINSLCVYELGSKAYMYADDEFEWKPMPGIDSIGTSEKIVRMFSSRFGNLFLATKNGATYTLWSSNSNGRTFVKHTSFTEEPIGLQQTHDSSVYVVTTGRCVIVEPNGTVKRGEELSSITSVRDADFTKPYKLMGIRSNQVIQSLDSGKTWSPFLTGLPTPLSVGAAGIVSSSTGDAFLFLKNGTENMIAILKNGLSTWNPPRPLQWEFRKVVVFSNGLILGTTSTGIYRGDEGGNSWEQTSTGISSIALIRASLTSNKNILITDANGGIFIKPIMSTSQWGSVTLPPDYPNSRLVYEILPTNGREVLLMTSQGLLQSNDNGNTFRYTQLNGANSTTPVYSAAIAGSEMYALTANQVIRSSDNGLTWISAFTVPVTKPSHLARSSNGLYVGTDNGVVEYSTTGTVLETYSSTKNSLLASSSNAVNFLDIVGSEVSLFTGKSSTPRVTFNVGSVDYPPTIAAQADGQVLISGATGLFSLMPNSNELMPASLPTSSPITSVTTNFDGTALATSVNGRVYAQIPSSTEYTTENASSILLAPNPATNAMQIIQTGNEQALSYTIYSLLGEAISSGEIIHQTQSISTSHLSTGMYSIAIQTATSVHVKRLIIQR